MWQFALLGAATAATLVGFYSRGLSGFVLFLVGMAGLASLASLFRVPADGKHYGEFALTFPFFSEAPAGQVVVPRWFQGVWAKTFGPGFHWIWAGHLIGRFTVQEATIVPPGFYGLVNALVGDEPREKGQVVSTRNIMYEDIIEGESFLGKGERGWQLLTLNPGIHLINQKMFVVSFKDAMLIEPGQVGAMVSNIGPKPDENDLLYIGTSPKGKPVAILKPMAGPGELPDDQHRAAIEKRGIKSEFLLPGLHLINTIAFPIKVVDTTPDDVPFDGRELFIGGESISFSPLANVVTQDGVRLNIKGALVLRVPPEFAPWVVALAGSHAAFVRDVVIPYLDHTVRTVIVATPAKDLLDKQQEVWARIEVRLRAALEGPENARKALAKPTDELLAEIEEGAKVDSREYYPVKLDSFRLGSLESDSPEWQALIDARSRKAIADQAVDAVVAETKVAVETVKREEQVSLANEQPTIARARARELAAKHDSQGIKAVREVLPEGLPQLAAPLVPSLIEVMDALSDRLRGRANQPPSPPPSPPK